MSEQTPRFRPAIRDRRARGGRTRDRAGSAGVIGTVASNAQRSRLPQMAAALAYRTIFGLIPVMVVALVALKMFTSEEDIQHLMTQAMDYTGISRIALKEEVDPLPPEALRHTWTVSVGASPLPQVLLPESLIPAPDADKPGGVSGVAVSSTGSAGLDEWITGLVTRVSKIPFKTIGAIGLLALIYAAISMLVEVERAFNQIYRVPIGRSWARRVTNYWTLLTLGIVLLCATFYIGEQFKNWAARMAERGGLLASGSAANDAFSIKALGFAVTVCISTGLLLLAYTTVPNTRVRLRPALAGAFIAALLWESGKWGFTLYLDMSTNYTRLYGSLAILPLFLLWIYLTWLIVLVGLQISYFLQFEQYRRTPVAADAAKLPAVADPALGASVMAAAARAFRDGGTLTLAGIAGTVRATDDAVRAVVGRLVDRGLLREVTREDGPVGYVLGRPADLIQVSEVLEASYGLVAPPPGQEPDPVLERLHQAQLEGVRGQTVASMIADDAAPAPVRTPAPVAADEHAPGHANGRAKDAPAPGQPATAPATLPPVG